VARRTKRPTKESVEQDLTGELRLYAQLGLRVPAEIAIRLKRYCQESGKSVNKAVMEALAQYLSEKNR
jgi:predicted HicB family RNase H-like nuclease